ncbi:hypothetical protein [Glaciecola sp. MF2-115]|uniref:hypothetical protein n=1 Tax=Glaciecola sp. MF2-115 TaxID=3384827 RepID=UPI0039A32C1D
MKKLKAIVVASLIVTFCVACTQEQGAPMPINPEPKSEKNEVLGTWIIDLDGDVMLNPQTSGLKYSNGFLYTVSDASAHESQILRLHQISMGDSKVVKKYAINDYSEAVKNSCFFTYLSNKPDYEALAPLPGEDNAWVFVTEDASRNEQLSETCQQQYAESGSTFYPTLVVRLQLQGESLALTHVRPIQFPSSAEVGDFPNDGIEGLSITRDNRLLLGLERDSKKQPRVFELKLGSDFWQESGFAKVQDSELLLPTFEQGNHPINGMDVVYPSSESEGYLLAAARNDNELWVVDLAKKKPTKRIKFDFFAPSDTSQNDKESEPECADKHLMDNSSIEGLAVVADELWMVNDPWKANYHKNIVCPADQHKYQKMAPLLFKMKIDKAWFE